MLLWTYTIHLKTALTKQQKKNIFFKIFTLQLTSVMCTKKFSCIDDLTAANYVWFWRVTQIAAQKYTRCLRRPKRDLWLCDPKSML